ncbi:hypothetical protein BKA82DRAFT_4119678 [Pisolithus tinctorius]|nr:hypothetical protein BKA82DRAFT_4119678 [Pisolithus tinctorius]
MCENAPGDRWDNLMVWLKKQGAETTDLAVECRKTQSSGYGLFARRSCPPGSLLFSIPAKAMINVTTLRPHYPPKVVQALTGIQLVSMHLFLWRPKGDNEDSEDPLFGPYISTLPREFGSHPLTWVVQSKHQGTACQDDHLLRWLPPSVSSTLDRLHHRFTTDWSKVHSVMIQPLMSAKLRGPPAGVNDVRAVMDFLWAWLNVNTRCIYYRLKSSKSNPDNFTLCPILDFANHNSCTSNMRPGPTNADIWNSAPVPSIGEGLRFFACDDARIQDDDEIMLTYGCHSNKTLFAEYGFVNGAHDVATPACGEVDVQDVVEESIYRDQSRSRAIKDLLVGEGHWGDCVLFSTPDSAQVSWPLIAALRLHHLMGTAIEIDNDIQLWRDVIAGRRELVSDDNEQSCRDSILHICDEVIGRAQRVLEMNIGQSLEQQYIRSLWAEELFVARAVKESVYRGDAF